MHLQAKYFESEAKYSLVEFVFTFSKIRINNKIALMQTVCAMYLKIKTPILSKYDEA